MGLFSFYITTTATSSVTNTATVTYSETDSSSTAQSDEISATVTVSDASGTISGLPTGTIEVYKVVEGTTVPIEGVHFNVYKVVSETDHTRVTGWYDGADYAEIVTDEDGIASIANLNDGYYEIEESSTDLPNWIADSDLTTVYVYLGDSSGTETKIENNVKTGDITATKVWLQADGTTADTDDHETVYFKLYRNIDGEEAEAVYDAEIMAVTTVSGESEASVTWEDLPLYDNYGNEYTYSVKEVDADGNDTVPDGYTKTEDGLTVTNTKNTDETTSTTESTTQSSSSSDDADTTASITLSATTAADTTATTAATTTAVTTTAEADTTTTTTATATTTAATAASSVPSTGDSSHIGFWLILMVTSAAVLAYALIQKRQTN